MATSPYGVTPTGFYSKPLDIIDGEVDADLQNILGNSAGTDSDGTIPDESMAGQLKSMLVDGYSAMWDLLQAAFANQDPNQAAGTFLDIISSLSGTKRNAARPTVATGIVVGTPNTILPPNVAATVGGTTQRFITPTGLTVSIATGAPYVPLATHIPGELCFNNGNVYRSLTLGFGGFSGPSGVGPYIQDNGVTWAYLGAGIGYAYAEFLSQVVGPIGVATGSLNTIATPINGWNAVYNPQAGIVGVVTEADASLRTRRDQEIATTGNATADAILANVAGVNQGSTDPNHQAPSAVQVFYNFTDVTNGNGLPPHSVEVLVSGGTAADVVQMIWDSVAAGTATYGNTSGIAVDSEGQNQVVNYSIPNLVPVWVTAAGGYDATQWPANSQGLVAQGMLSAFLTETEGYPIGRDVRPSPLNSYIMSGPAGTTGGLALVPAPASNPSVVGLLEVYSLQLGTGVSPTGTTTIPMGIRDQAVFDISRCVFTAVPETP